MKFYFSGTGNSLDVAKKLGNKEEQVISIARLMTDESSSLSFDLTDGEAIGFIFPIYAWAPPKMVLDFINKVTFNNYKNNYIYFVATCGENAGETSKVMSKSLMSKGLKLNSGFSMVMPNNYIIMGNVYNDEKNKELLVKAEERIAEINSIIKERKADVFQVEKGPVPFLLTGVINPFFSKFATNTKSFNVNNQCIGCRICEKVCNSKTIKVKGKPTWGEECTGCLACIHYCPTKAINYGKSTIKKGRYVNPNVNNDEMKLR